MRSILWWLGVLLGFAVARSLDAAWVMFFYVGDRTFPLLIQIVLDAVWLGAAGLAAGLLARWLAGWTSVGIGLALGLVLLAATGVDLILHIANEPWWHEAITALVMIPAAAFGGGFRVARRAPGPSPVEG
jgi:hypothetical protein